MITVIRCSEDGDHSIYTTTKEAFVKQLEADYPDREPDFMNAELLGQRRYLDLNTFSGFIVIDGPIVVPKPKTIVTSWQL